MSTLGRCGSLFFIVFTTSDFCGRTRLTDRVRTNGAKSMGKTDRLLGVRGPGAGDTGAGKKLWWYVIG